MKSVETSDEYVIKLESEITTLKLTSNEKDKTIRILRTKIEKITEVLEK